MSFLNYRLAEASPRSDWLSAGLPFGGNTTIAAVIDAASDNSLRDGFSPFSSLHDYVRGGTTTTTLLCSLDEFAEFLRRNLSFSGCPDELPQSNISPRSHGEPRADQVERVAALLHKDLALWEAACGSRDAAGLVRRPHPQDAWISKHLSRQSRLRLEQRPREHGPRSRWHKESLSADTMRVTSANGRAEELYMLHIPKTAVTSFHGDCQKYVDGCEYVSDPSVPGEHLIQVASSEGCFEYGTKVGLPVATFVREPRAHVVSQYYHCKLSEDHAYARGLMPDTIHEWVAAWAQSTHKDTAALKAAPQCKDGDHGIRHVNGPTGSPLKGAPFCCYFPWNLQTQRLTCSRVDEHRPWQGRHNNLMPHVNVTLALENAGKARFVGLVEMYQESMCLFVARTAGAERMPAFCNCEDEEAWRQFNSTDVTHGGYVHPSPDDLPKGVLTLIDKLVQKDRQVYDAMRARFLEEVARVEAASGRRVLCDDARKRLESY